ncbi:glycerol-3-phosphate 1-O-acyltransferase PlsY [Acerihabitans arboris]|uniref:Glycerol-3-phosphate acyltransferase n=1 Tax=Acerihabitans arboris TaxID=2691583 RepID=A0A845SFI8_9GAMM|nr:glycerol-3-phosphate 1-O-acyltransferase PlsY [Acerihabitans arboris]NDL63600.1 glycerol-3-phosphate 1-O-acyltransferase PlsY [Acerihabitans arboris]
MNAIAIGMIIFAYLCGSVSSAILICKLARLPDPRTHGSGNPGATNVLRIGGKTAAASVMVFDVLKGMLPVWLGYHLGVPPFYLGLIAIAACIGHIYPVFFHFQGGKGVATAFGAIAPIGWDLTGLMAGTWLLTVLLSGYSSLGAIISALIAPFYVWWFKPQFTFPVSMLSCLVLLRHHDNIQRLWRGQESRIWRKRQKDKDIDRQEGGQPGGEGDPKAGAQHDKAPDRPQDCPQDCPQDKLDDKTPDRR